MPSTDAPPSPAHRHRAALIAVRAAIIVADAISVMVSRNRAHQPPTAAPETHQSTLQIASAPG